MVVCKPITITTITHKGSISGCGYRQHGGRNELEHRIVWTMRYGPIPPGMLVHHKDGDKLNNNIDNLELVDPATHQRLHKGYKLVDGVWWKRCGDCGEVKQLESSFYKRASDRGDGKLHYRKSCIPCWLVRVKKEQKIRREEVRNRSHQ